MAALGLAGGAYDVNSKPLVAQECVNLYPEVMETSARSRAALRRCPGLSSWATTGESSIRGWAVMNSVLYVVAGTTLYSVTTLAVVTPIGLIPGTERCAMAVNGSDVMLIVVGGNADFLDQYFIVSGTIVSGYTYSVAAGLALITDADFPVGNNGAAFYISNLNSGTAWTATDFAAAEAAPDDILAQAVSHRELILLGGKPNGSIEFWRNTGNVDFPFERQDGTHQDRGCAARHSVVVMDNRVMFLGDDGIVYVINQYTPTRISNFGVESWLASVEADWSTATACGHTWRGHHFYALTISNRTFVYDATQSELTGRAEWHERRSDTGEVRWRPDMTIRFAGRVLAASTTEGVIYALSDSVYTDGGNEVELIRAIAPVSADVKSISIPRLELRMESGTGSLSENPIIMLQISRDGGRTFDSGIEARTGLTGDYASTAVWRRLGRADDWLFRFKSTDPYKQTWIEAHADLFIGN